MNEPTFRRSPHNKLNPYVQISREMAQDKSISPKAKGVLLYLLSLPDDWKVYHSQLQSGLGIGEDYLNSAMDELLNAGYAERTREKVKGLFQPYQYTINEFKICLPDRENQPGSTGPENPGIHKKEKENKYKEQQHAALAAAVFPESSKKEKPTPKIYDCLIAIDIPMKDKYEISTRYDEETVNSAVSWATHPQTVITKGLVQAIKWACQNRPEMPKNKEDIELVNKTYAFKYDGLKNKSCEIVCCNKYVEIVLCGNCEPKSFKYDEKGFMEKFNEALKSCGFKILE